MRILRPLRAVAVVVAAAAVWITHPAIARAGAGASPTPSAWLARPSAETKRGDEARARLKAADAEMRRRFDGGDLEGALEAAGRAWRAWPSTYTAEVRGRLQEKLGRPCQAFVAYLEARARSEQEKEKDVRRLETKLEALGPRCSTPLGWATVEIDPAGATVEISGLRFVAPETIGIVAGRHGMVLEAPGRAQKTLLVRIRAGKHTLLKFDLLPRVSETHRPVAGDAAEKPVPVTVVEAPVPVLPWVLVGSGAAVIASGLGFTLWADGAANDANDAASRATGLGPGEELDLLRAEFDKADEARKSRQVVSYVLYGVGGAALVTGVVLLFTRDTSQPSSVELRPTFLPGVGGLSLSGRF